VVTPAAIRALVGGPAAVQKVFTRIEAVSVHGTDHGAGRPSGGAAVPDRHGRCRRPVSFELRGHTADVAVAARGGALGEAFAAVAAGLAAAMCDEIPDTGGERHEIEVRAEDRESLLFDYLDELIYRRDVESVLPVDHEARVGETNGEWRLTGSFRGVPLADVVARDVKAVTYSEMCVERDGEEWTAYVVLDV